jgi:hypothetical protein
MSSDGEKCLELILLDGSNYKSWCNSILHYIEVFNPYLLNIVDASICPPNINWANLSEKEGKCLKLNTQAFCILTQSLSPNVEAIIIKKHEFLVDAHLLWIYIKNIFSDTTIAQDSRGAGCLIKPVEKIGQTDLAKSAGSRLQRIKCHRSNQNSICQISPLPSASHGKCLMAKDKKKKKPMKDEREEEEDEYDFDFDKLSKKDMIKIKSLFERLREQELLLEQEYLIGKIEELKALNEEYEKLKHSHISLIDKHEYLEKKYVCTTNVSSCVDPLEMENANLKAQLEVLTSKHVKMRKDYDMFKCSLEDL